MSIGVIVKKCELIMIYKILLFCLFNVILCSAQTSNEDAASEAQAAAVGSNKLSGLKSNLFTITDCSDAKLIGYGSGVYTVNPEGSSNFFKVYCDLSFDGGRWTVIQKRFNGNLDFYRNFSEYAAGFGELPGEHWIGLNALYELTSRKNYQLYIELEDFENEKKFANYKNFAIDSENEGYRLRIGNYCGNAGDSMSRHNLRKFSTFDVDNDLFADNCALVFKGAWWYDKCVDSNLNGRYLLGNTHEFPFGLVWKTWKGSLYSLKKSKMMIRPLDDTEEDIECLNPDLTTVDKSKGKFKTLEDRFIRVEEILEQLLIASNKTATQDASIPSKRSLPKECSEVRSSFSGIYEIQPETAPEPFKVYCDAELLNEKWTVIQYRYDGSVDFYRSYKEYREGFGYLDSEHWLGLEHMHELTKNDQYELYIHLADFENATKHARYGNFSVGPAEIGYQLNIAGYSGDAGDPMGAHNGVAFSTYDRDQDNSNGNCAADFHSAWWYNSCHENDLNGVYGGGPIEDKGKGLLWNSWRGNYYSLRVSKMLIRKKRN